MPRGVVVLMMAFLSVAAPMAAQDSVRQSSAPKAKVAIAARTQPPLRFTRLHFNPVPRPLTSHVTVTPAPPRRSKAPVVGGMLLGAIAGFFAGNYVQHSACEYDCGPGGFTWGFTAAGAAAGATIGWLFR